MNTSNKVNSFFSGIGGFDLAFQRQGYKTVLLCEINTFCNKILNKHWPKVKKLMDINSVLSEEIPKADVWCGGFPCQDISLARGSSERLGLKGARSGLFYKFAELINDCKPKIVLIENVGGLFNSNKGRDFGTILQTLSCMGYGVSWRLLNSRYFGVPQSRTRVYICCWLNDPTKALNVMFDKEGAPKPENERTAFITEDIGEGGYPIVPKISYCLAASSGRHTGTDWSRTYVVNDEGVRRLTPIESERIQGFPDNWTLPLGEKEDNPDLDTLRYNAIGNAVSVPVIEWIASRIKGQAKKRYEKFIFDRVIDTYADFKVKGITVTDISNIDFTSLEDEHKWLRGGIVWNGKCLQTNAYTTPALAKETTLLPLIEREQYNPHFYLTPNAAEGILRRVDHQHRTLFFPLRKALEKLKSLNV